MKIDELDVTLDLAELLDEASVIVKRYVVLPSREARVAAVLWIAATHAQAAWENAPRFVLQSPTKRSGKSRCLDVMEAMSHNSLLTVNCSIAALVRSISPDDPPTLFIDEADTLFGSRKVAENNEDLRGIINAGHQRNRPYVRWDMIARKREDCPTFCMVMTASIGPMPDTIEDRGIVVHMRRRVPGEVVEPFRTRRDAPALHDLRDRLNVAIRARLGDLRDAVPDMPVEDRAADTWEPLVAIADLAGGKWPALAREACVVTVNAADAVATESSIDQKLLEGVRDSFIRHGATFLASRDLVAALVSIDDAPWADFNFTTNMLARKLQRFGIRSRRDTSGSRRGYYAADCRDAFARYLTDADAGAGLTVD